MAVNVVKLQKWFRKVLLRMRISKRILKKRIKHIKTKTKEPKIEKQKEQINNKITFKRGKDENLMILSSKKYVELIEKPKLKFNGLKSVLENKRRKNSLTNNFNLPILKKETSIKEKTLKNFENTNLPSSSQLKNFNKKNTFEVYLSNDVKVENEEKKEEKEEFLNKLLKAYGSEHSNKKTKKKEKKARKESEDRIVNDLFQIFYKN